MSSRIKSTSSTFGNLHTVQTIQGLEKTIAARFQGTLDKHHVIWIVFNVKNIVFP